MDTSDIKLFLEQNILKCPILKMKKFGKGQVSSFYVLLANKTQLSIKFYNCRQAMQYAYNVARCLEQNLSLAVPRLYQSANCQFQYKQFWGLCFYYIEGREISASALNKRSLTEVADAYYKFQTPLNIDFDLYKDKNLNTYFNELKENYLSLKSKNIFHRIYFNCAIYFIKKFISLIEQRHIGEKDIPQKMIHNDITKSNMLFHKGHFVAFLDTDAVCSSYIGKDFAEFIISSVLHYPFFKSKRKSIDQWYELIDERFKLSFEEYVYGLDVYYLYRIMCRIKQYQKKMNFCKIFGLLDFLWLNIVSYRAILRTTQKKSREINK